MLHVSDPRLDAGALRSRLRRNAEQRYFTMPLAVAGPPAEPAAPAAAAPVAGGAGWRRQLKRLPLAGPGLAWGWRRWTRMREPGLAPAERLRAMPLVGDALAWMAALVTLVRWRAGLRRELADTRAELRQLQAQMVRQNLELSSLRRQMRRQDDAAARPAGKSRSS